MKEEALAERVDFIGGYFPRTISRIAFVGNYVPRQCGIATFTTDLCEAVAARQPKVDCFAIPVNDTEEGYDYPPRVRFELSENDVTSYRSAADFLNMGNANAVCLQHEYGIFGGAAGSHVLALLGELRIPVVTTLHTVLQEPDPNQRKVLEWVASLSDRLVVMSQRSVEDLQEIYGVEPAKIDFIHHGIPDVPFVDPNFYKDQFGVEGRPVLLTFGLLSRNKGIEHVIQALPAIAERHPDVVYIVLGATHPHVKMHEGESYRIEMERLVRELGVEENVIFHNRFVSLQELVEFIGATDIYVTPYLNPAQSTSGALAYTFGAGKAVISTPYWYAEELLAEDRGVLVPFASPLAIAESAIRLLDKEVERHAMRKKAYQLGREMIWPEVARRYMESFARAREERSRKPRAVPLGDARTRDRAELPQLNLAHLRRLTDDTGMLQHAVFQVPNYDKGYTTDDNARALIVAVLLEEVGERNGPGHADLSSRYLAFLWHAFDHQTARFHNEMSYDRRWLDQVGSEDSHARSLWALGAAAGRSENEGLRDLAAQLLEKALPPVVDFTSPRAWAFALIGIHEYLRRFPGYRIAREAGEQLASNLFESYLETASQGWSWFEDTLTYSNGKLPHALLLAGDRMGNREMVDAGLRALGWLVKVQTENGHFVPIGNSGFYRRGGVRARFDQQPVEAHSTVSACLDAYRMTSDPAWHEEAHRAFDWFLGGNDLRLPLYDPVTGGCYDGLHSDRVNRNQGAESTLSFLLSLLEMRLFEHIIMPIWTEE